MTPYHHVRPPWECVELVSSAEMNVSLFPLIQTLWIKENDQFFQMSKRTKKAGGGKFSTENTEVGTNVGYIFQLLHKLFLSAKENWAKAALSYEMINIIYKFSN